MDGHLDDKFEIIGEIMRNKLVASQLDETAIVEHVADAIRADAQQDVDAEVPNIQYTLFIKTNCTTRLSKMGTHDLLRLMKMRSHKTSVPLLSHSSPLAPTVSVHPSTPAPLIYGQ